GTRGGAPGSERSGVGCVRCGGAGDGAGPRERRPMPMARAGSLGGPGPSAYDAGRVRRGGGGDGRTPGARCSPRGARLGGGSAAMRTAAAIGGLGALAAGGLAGWDFAHEARRAASLDEALVASLRDLLVAGAIAAASLCLGLGWTYRVGRRPHCARCGYERVE